MTHRNNPVQHKKKLQHPPSQLYTKPQAPPLPSVKNPKESAYTYTIAFLLQLKDTCTDLPLGCGIPPELAVVPAASKPQISQAAAALRKPNVDSMESFQRNIQSLMNKLSPENFQSITEKLVTTITSAMETLPDPLKFLTSVVEVIFEKAVRESRYAERYSKLCVSLSQNLPQREGISFKKLLLQKCQQEFEQPTDTTSTNTPSNNVLDPEEIKNRLAERNSGVPVFIGALFLRGLISEKIIHYCLRTLLSTNESDLLKFASLMTLIGKTIDHPKAKILMDAYFVKMESLSKNQDVSRRIRFKLIDVVDLRNNNWQSKRLQIPPIKSEVNKQLNVQEGR